LQERAGAQTIAFLTKLLKVFIEIGFKEYGMRNIILLLVRPSSEDFRVLVFIATPEAHTFPCPFSEL
jgi:hypothetical protein